MRGLLELSLLFSVACTSNPAGPPSLPPTTRPSASAVMSFHAEPSAKVVDGGCALTHVYSGGVPATLMQAGGYNAPATPYAIADPPIAAGFIFSYPLIAGPPGNKILWVVGAPRDGARLTLDAHPMVGTEPDVESTSDPNSSSGEIYPSGVTVPTPGCWQITLTWGTHTAIVNLDFGTAVNRTG